MPGREQCAGRPVLAEQVQARLVAVPAGVRTGPPGGTTGSNAKGAITTFVPPASARAGPAQRAQPYQPSAHLGDSGGTAAISFLPSSCPAIQLDKSARLA